MRRKKMVVEIPNTIVKHLKKTERWTADDYAKLILLHNKGLPDTEIARIMGRTYNSVYCRLKKIKHKFKTMRCLNGWSGAERLMHSMKETSTGCKYHKNCDDCPFPACVYDGFDPTWIPPRKTSPKNWDLRDIQHWNELEHLPEPLDDATLANIFRTTVEDIQNYKHRTNMA